MKIFIISSKKFYKDIPMVVKKLQEAGHEAVMPILYDKPTAEQELREKIALAKTPEEQEKARAALANFKKKIYDQSEKAIVAADSVLCLNFDKTAGSNYIGKPP